MNIAGISFFGLGNGIVKLLLLIDSVVYGFISDLFSLYIKLAQAEIFNSDMYNDISSKIYLVMGVVAIFIFIYVMLQTIVNPDSVKKNGSNYLKKFVIAIIMIVLTPSLFTFLYQLQDAILTDNIIPNILLGNNFSEQEEKIYLRYLVDDNGIIVTDKSELQSVDYSNVEEDKLRYYFTDDCQYENYTTDDDEYKKALNSCEKLVAVNEETNAILSSYGNKMAFTLLNAFIHPEYGAELETVNLSERFNMESGTLMAAIGCGVGFVAGAIITIGGTLGSFGIGSIPAGVGGTGLIIALCGAGAAVGGVTNTALYLVDYEKYTWEMAINEMIHVGEFDRITAFDGEIIDGRMHYTPIISTICGLYIAYMLLSYCIDLGLRAAKLAFYQVLAPVTFLLNTIPGQKNLMSNWIKATLTTWGEVFIRIFTMVAAVYLISSMNIDQLDNFGFLASAIIVMGIITFVKQFPKLLGDLTGIKSENMKLGLMEKLGAGGALAAGALIGGGLTAGVRNITNSWRKNKGQNLGKRIFNTARSGIAGTLSGGFRSAKNAGFKAKSWGDMKNAATKGAKIANVKSKERALYKAMHGGTIDGAIVGRINDALTGAKSWAGLSSDILDIVNYEDEYISLFDDYAAIYSDATYKATESHLSQINARILAEGENARVSPGTKQTLKQAKKNLTDELTLMRLKAIKRSHDSAAYVAYNIARQVVKDPALAARAGVSDDFIKHADDFVLRGNRVYHADGRDWLDSELQQLFEATITNSVYNSSGDFIREEFSDLDKIKGQYLYSDFKGLNASKGEVKKKRTEDKNSIDYKEAKKAKDSSKS